MLSSPAFRALQIEVPRCDTPDLVVLAEEEEAAETGGRSLFEGSFDMPKVAPLDPVSLVRQILRSTGVHAPDMEDRAVALARQLAAQAAWRDVPHADPPSVAVLAILHMLVEHRVVVSSWVLPTNGPAANRALLCHAALTPAEVLGAPGSSLAAPAICQLHLANTFATLCALSGAAPSTVEALLDAFPIPAARVCRYVIRKVPVP